MGRITLVFSSEILKTQCGTMGDMGSFDSTGVQHYNGTGKTIDLTAFQEHLRSRIDPTMKNKYRQCSVNGYMMSHEITLEHKVPIDEHLKAVLACDAQTKRLVKRCLAATPDMSSVPCFDISNKTYIQIINAL